MGGDDRDSELRRLFEDHWSALCRLAFLMLGDRAGAEECVQDAYLGVFRAWDRVRTMDRPDLYLRTAVVNRCRSRLRRRRLERRPPGADPPGAGPESANAEPGDAGVRDEVLTVVRRLPARQRAAVILRYYEDRSEAEIAAALDCSTGTVKSQLAKARATLRRALGPHAGDDV